MAELFQDNVSIMQPSPSIRHDWRTEEALGLLRLPFHELMFQAQTVHRRHHEPGRVQMSALLSIKTGGCPEDCKYCPQSAHYETPVTAEKRMDVAAVLEGAQRAKEAGATRFCMGAAWRSPKPRDMEDLCAMVRGVREMGLESCMTLGMLSREQAQTLKEAGLDYYNHNLDTSESFYDEIITTRTYQERLDTLAHVREAGMHVCCGGIIGMGESVQDRAEMLVTLANLPEHPESVPINQLVKVEGTPFAQTAEIDSLDMVRMIAAARLMMPLSQIRLSAGREQMPDSVQALCFLAGANSIFYGEKLLTTPNPDASEDQRLLERLGMEPATLNA